MIELTTCMKDGEIFDVLVLGRLLSSEVSIELTPHERPSTKDLLAT